MEEGRHCVMRHSGVKSRAIALSRGGREVRLLAVESGVQPRLAEGVLLRPCT